MMKTYWTTAAAALLALAALPAGLAQAQQPVRGGVLPMVLAAEPPTLVSAHNSSLFVGVASTKMHEGLVKYGPNMEMLPSLAESWEFSPDGLTMKFNLRKGVKWHDGQPFTSADVKYSMEEVWKKLNPRAQTLFASVAGVETPDESTAIIKLARAAPALLVALDAYDAQIVPKHVYDGKDFGTNPALQAPIGTGPFKFKEWKKGQYLELVRNDDYWDKGKPYLDGMTIQFIGDAAGRAVAFETGTALYAPFSPVPASDVARLEKNPQLTVETAGYAVFAPMQLIEINNRQPPLNDPRVRQALRYAINLDFIVKNIWFGFGTPATGPLQSTSAFYLKDLPQYQFDAAKANRLLDDAGLKKDASGNRFSIRVIHGTTGEIARTAEYLKQAFARIGVQVKLEAGDVGTTIRRVYGENDFDLYLNSMFLSADPTIGVQRLYWSGAIKKGVPFSNSSGYSTPALDKIWEQTQVEADPAKRKALFAEMQRIVQNDLPIIPLLESKYFTMVNKKLRNHTVTADGPYGSFADAWLAP